MDEPPRDRPSTSLLREIVYYVRRRKKYLLIPVIVALFLCGLLILASETLPLVSPFIYVLF